MDKFLEYLISSATSSLGIISITLIIVSIIGFLFLHKTALLKTRVYGSSIFLSGLILFGVSVSQAINPSNRPPTALLNIENINPSSIIIGGENYLEANLLLEIMAKVIEKEEPFLDVIRNHNIGETIRTFNALKEGQIDLYSEYSGTVISQLLNRPLDANKDEYLETNKMNELLKNNPSTKDLIWTPHFGYNNPYVLIILRDNAIKKRLLPENGTLTISRLSTFSKGLIFKSTHEFFYRSDGLKGLEKQYGLYFKEKGLIPHQKKYKALIQGEMDVTDAYLTDPQIHQEGNPYLKIDDDKGFFPKYYPGALVRRASLKKHPGIEKALNKLADRITAEEMANLIDQGLKHHLDKLSLNNSDTAQQELHLIVSEFLIKKGLI